MKDKIQIHYFQVYCYDFQYEEFQLNLFFKYLYLFDPFCCRRKNAVLKSSFIILSSLCALHIKFSLFRATFSKLK